MGVDLGGVEAVETSSAGPRSACRCLPQPVPRRVVRPGRAAGSSSGSPGAVLTAVGGPGRAASPAHPSPPRGGEAAGLICPQQSGPPPALASSGDFAGRPPLARGSQGTSAFSSGALPLAPPPPAGLDFFASPPGGEAGPAWVADPRSCSGMVLEWRGFRTPFAPAQSPPAVAVGHRPGLRACRFLG